ncbi:ABC transporter ATP-binding protein [Occultella glacieicola]|uniref:ABC transporter ATP-binding protein n=1 Tax=Occultella glacieicola TaxID=2518684 RepID=A0ABY2E415_9MICO|nr:ABC transporter ATP-binding protein [Occultella glacieicola]TDE94774.1 ABC transporter ATP-binding protein [Occultella glacieicola]
MTAASGSGEVIATIPVATTREVWRTCTSLLRRRAWLVIAVACAFVVAAAAGLVLPTALGRIVDLATAPSSTDADVWRLGAWMAAGAIVQALATGAGSLGAAALVENLLAELREGLVTSALRLPRRVVERVGTGDLTSRASDDVAQVAAGLPNAIPTVAASGFTLVLTVIALTVLNPWFALVVLTVVPLQVIALRSYLRNAPPIYAAERAAVGVRAHHVLAALRGLPTVQAFGLGAVHSARIGFASWQVVQLSLRARAVVNTFFSRLNTAELVGMSTILVVAFVLVGGDQLTIGGATTAMLLFLQLFGPMMGVLLLIDELQSALASLARIVGVTRMEPGTDDQRRPHGELPVAVSGVRFGYDGAAVLHQVDLRVRAGERVAVVGTSGAGKSTLAALVAGVHAPWSGAVSVSDAAHARTVLISQEVHVFAGTVRDNLTLGRPEATDTEIRAALGAVGATDEVAALPHGLDTEVGPHAHTLTVAQAQLVALARAHLADPELVLLDEATAEAGSAHGAMLDRAADAVMSERAALIIAHRLDQAVRADRVVVMADGRVVEEGPHDELVAAGGAYAELWSAWQRHRP